MSKPDVLFVLSIDTEEEWQWGEPFPESDFAVDNVKHLPSFQYQMEQLGIRPTYFVDYPVLDNPTSLEQFKQVIKHRQCEVGAHLHPWCNPPYFGPTTEFESHVVNLPREHVATKLDALIQKTQDTLGIIPQSFRTGRWGINETIFELLVERGIWIDSSVYPMYDNDYFSCYEAPFVPYYPDFGLPNFAGQQRHLLELPVTVGFNRMDDETGRHLQTKAEKGIWHYCRANALLWHLKLLRKLYLSPELSSIDDMKSLVDNCLRQERPVIHMYLHSSSFLDNGTGFYLDKDAHKHILDSVTQVFEHLSQQANVTCATISEAGHLLGMQNQVSGHTQPLSASRQDIRMVS